MATPMHTGHRSYKAVVIDSLVDDIVSGEIPPGSKLSENRLAQRYGTSRMPVREALIELNRRGMVRVVPQVGTFVVEVSPERIVSQFEVREALEVEAARLSSLRSDEKSLAAMADILDRMQIAASEGSLRRYVALDEEFHAAIFDCAKNETLRDHYTMLMSALGREYMAMIVSTLQGRMRRSLSEHIAVYEAIHTGDVETADSAMRAHVSHGRIELERALAERLEGTD